ncbi:putative sugar O-methyltransferase [Luteipulveratus sp. YIM 133132]|uniref:Sugar O-methyltransferase n=1 Tax=Luteipulveratus flavus TaxID=3031728 RepID=A0ABT6CA43_9MICO|nr:MULTISPECIES: putative sugar O-methyltransferase [unclassified Luteipulveratus]MDE9364591.1 putative sugar O-methyltransferase [Luteipulveratus sp. YIM 133132]MDF8265748.1 putative sugar O-methyltransferase [Luteipulveratus sp. YIM 133296]
MTWTEMTTRTLAELREAKPIYQPTNFWGPGVEALLSDMESAGLESFKSWRTAHIWFNPMYGNGYTNASIGQILPVAQSHNRAANLNFLSSALNGSMQASRDFDVASVAWDQTRWPFDLVKQGESRVGRPGQAYPLSGIPEVTFGRAYVNYLLCLSALSRHVDAPPRSFLEIGGGFGVLGEIVMSRDSEARYVDLDIPPLMTVASYYLCELFGRDRVTVYDESLSRPGAIRVPASGVVPNYRIEDLEGEFEVFVNSFSFQEMEPDVVEHYVDQVCAKGIRYAVSLNSRQGKPKAAEAGQWGALDPVKSADIAAMFAKHGFVQVGEYDQPMIRSGGQLIVLRRD